MNVWNRAPDVRRWLLLAVWMTVLGTLIQPTAAQTVDPAVEANLKTLYEAFEKYRADHDGQYPPLGQKNAAGDLVLWPELLKPYLNDESPAGRVDVNGPLFSPSVSMADRRGGRAAVVTFGYNRFGLGADAISEPGKRRLVRSMPHPGRTLLLVECDAPKPSGKGWYAAYPNGGLDFAISGGKAHVLFCDGHVELLSPEELNVGKSPETDRAPWFGDLSKGGAKQGNAEGSATGAAKEEDAAAVEVPVVAVARISEKPAIDGRIEAGEWAGVTTFTGYRQFTTGLLASTQMMTSIGYDDTHLYACFVVPHRRGDEPMARITRRDGRVYRDDAVELILQPAPGEPIRQIVINSRGTVYDRIGGDDEWNADVQVKAGQGEAAELPANYRQQTHAWWVELAVPLADLQLQTPRPGDEWRANFCLDGKTLLTFSPDTESFLNESRFARLVFTAPDVPVLHMPTLGNPSFGQLAIAGQLAQHEGAASQVTFDVYAEKQGTHIVERTGFDEIVGAIAQGKQTVTVAGGESADLDVQVAMANPQLDRLKLAAVTDDKQTLYQNHWAFSVLPPLLLEVANYPSKHRVDLGLDVSGLAGSLQGVTAEVQLIDAAGQVAAAQSVPMTSRFQRQSLDVTSVAAGQYELKIALRRAGEAEPIAVQTATVERVAEPFWFAKETEPLDHVIAPFEPVRYEGQREISVWRRQVTWDDRSILPAQMSGADQPLLAGPIALVVEWGGKRETVALSQFTWTSQSEVRGEFTFAGASPQLNVAGTGWVEYDGLVWFDVNVQPKAGSLPIDALRLELPLDAKHAKYYHAVPDRTITGAVKRKTVHVPEQYFFWVGEPQRGLGFVTESLEHWQLGDDHAMHSVEPGDGVVTWRVNLINRPTTLKAAHYAFGLQATPVKPLPPDYHSWLVVNYDTSANGLYQRYREHVDLATIWSMRPKFVDYFCDPMGIKPEVVTPKVQAAHADRVPALVYFAPFSFTEDARPLHHTFASEWAQLPITKWTCEGTVQTRACVNSNTWADYLLAGFRKTVRENKADGLYFDGALPLPCVNQAHGCGWTDEQGKVHATVPVLAMRRFMMRVAAMLEREVSGREIVSRPGETRPTWPKWYVWSHISGAVCPPVSSHNTLFLSGEWFKGQIRQGVGYERLLSRDTFRPRYLSSPWGIPNAFLSITLDASKEGSPQTQAILAHILPQGVPIYGRYLDPELRQTVIDAMIAFDTRSARFTPAWQENPVIAIDTAGNDQVLLGTWDRNGEALVVVTNVGDTPATATLQWPSLGSRRVQAIFPASGAIEADAGGSGATVALEPHTIRLLHLGAVGQ